MAEFPTYEEMAKNVAEKALDDFLYNGKSIREWMQIIASEDCISRKQALEEIDRTVFCYTHEARQIIEDLPSIQPKPKTDVIDNIRAKIKEVQTYKMFEGEDTVYVERKDVLAIIDKYKSEKE